MTHALPTIEAPSKRRRDGSEKYTGAEVCITSHHSGIIDVGKLCPTFNGIWKGPSRDQDKHSFAPVYSSTTSIPTITQPSSWKSTLSSLVTRSREAVASGSRPPIILLTGAKGAGKSTFSRILANTLLTAGRLDGIAYLDIDPGQPEFTPSGTISLSHLTAPILGPPFTHAITPTRWHHIGYTSPREDPAHYIISIIDLLSSYRQSHSSAPLLINTMGWTKGLGLELLQDILAHSQASDIVFLGNGGAQSVAEIIPANTAILHEIASAGGVAPSRFAPADLRMLHTLSYFHRRDWDWDFSTPLTGFAPWVVPYTGPERGIDAVHILGESVVPEELATAVEGTIIGIVVVAEHNLPETYRASESSLPVITAPLTPEVAECRGLAVIRAIDAANGVVHLLSPVVQEEVERWDREGLRVVLVRGRLDLSPWEMVMPGGGVVDGPWISSGEGKKVGGAVWRVRRNVMRRGQQ
jgi:polynucleotide 5'-hydroxyl-kinase GRC3/NOL9